MISSSPCSLCLGVLCVERSCGERRTLRKRRHPAEVLFDTEDTEAQSTQKEGRILLPEPSPWPASKRLCTCTQATTATEPLPREDHVRRTLDVDTDDCDIVRNGFAGPATIIQRPAAPTPMRRSRPRPSHST